MGNDDAAGRAGEVLVDATSLVLASRAVEKRAITPLTVFALADIVEDVILFERFRTHCSKSHVPSTLTSAVRSLGLEVPILRFSKKDRDEILAVINSKYGVNLDTFTVAEGGGSYAFLDNFPREMEELLLELFRDDDQNVVGRTRSGRRRRGLVSLMNHDGMDAFRSLYLYLRFGESAKRSTFVEFRPRAPRSRMRPGQIMCSVVYRAEIYLLLSSKFGIPYAPDALRSDYVHRALSDRIHRVPNMARILLRNADQLEEARRIARNSMDSIGTLPIRIPLILNSVLARIDRPDQLMDEARTIARGAHAGRLRNCLARIQKDAVSVGPARPDSWGDLIGLMEASEEFIREEYGSSPNNLQQKTITGSIDTSIPLAFGMHFGGLVGGDGTKELISLISRLLAKGPASFLRRRNVTFVRDTLDVVRNTLGLRGELERVFGQALSNNEMSLLSRLRNA